MIQINVMLVTSEYSFLYRMESDLNLLKSRHYRRPDNIIHFGEIPPGEMFDLLTTKWGMKDNLALAFVDTYGGHIRNASAALVDLALFYQPDGESHFMPENAFGTSISDVQPCIFWAIENNQEIAMRTALQALAENGYFEVFEPENDRIAETISCRNVGGLVMRGSFSTDLKVSVWAKTTCNYLCVPSSQAMRLIIANASHWCKRRRRHETYPDCIGSGSNHSMQNGVFYIVCLPAYT